MQDLINYLPAYSAQQFEELTDKQKKYVFAHTQQNLKSTGTAYVFWFLIGSHYGYLDNWGTQLLFWLTAGGVMIWFLIDLFRIPSLVKKHNAKQMAAAINTASLF